MKKNIYIKSKNTEQYHLWAPVTTGSALNHILLQNLSYPAIHRCNEVWFLR